MQKKKIILVGTSHPFRGGLASYNERLIREFINQGHEAEIYTFSLQYPNFLFPGETQYSESPAPKDLPIKIKVNSVNPFNWIKIGRELRKLKPDIVIFKYWLPFMAPCFGKISRIVRKNNHTKVITIIDNIIPHEARFGDKQLSKYFVNSVDGFIAMSDSVMEDLKQFDMQKPRLYNPHPLFDNFGEAVSKIEAKKHLGLDENSKYILFFGFVRDYKGLDLLLEAFADKRFRDKDIKLIIAGEYYNNPEKYLKLIDKYGLDKDVVQFKKFIADEEVKYYFCASDIVAQPYKTATQSGVSQIAYHFDKPMLVTNVGGLPELVPHNKVGFVTEPKSEEIANSLLRFYDENKEEEFASNVRKEKERFSWGKMVDKVFEIERQLRNK